MAFVKGTKSLFRHKIRDHIRRTNKKGLDIAQLGVVAAEEGSQQQRAAAYMRNAPTLSASRTLQRGKGYATSGCARKCGREMRLRQRRWHCVPASGVSPRS